MFRSFFYLFQQLQQRQENTQFVLKASFLEIYNEKVKLRMDFNMHFDIKFYHEYLLCNKLHARKSIVMDLNIHAQHRHFEIQCYFVVVGNRLAESRCKTTKAISCQVVEEIAG